MPDDVVLIAEPRSERGSGAAGRLRRSGRLPAVVYGLGGDVAEVSVPTHELDLILAHGANSLITLRIAGDEQLALARQVQRHPVRHDLLHVDFVRVSVDVAITADVALVLHGEPEGVRDGGMLEQQVFSVPVEAKPQDIPAQLEADVSALTLGDHLRLSDVTLPPGVSTPLDPETLLASVAIPRGLAGGEEEEAAEGEEAGEGETASDAGGSEGADADEA